MRIVGAAVLAVALALTGCGGATGGQQADPTNSDAASQLDGLTAAAPHAMTGYSRDRFPHWRRINEYCDVRDAVLKRDGTEVHVTHECNVTNGRWLSPYDQKTLTNLSEVDIDHVVALADGWRSGADRWTDQQRADFANDLVRPQLRAVSMTVNRAKGDQDPSRWRPPNRGYWCEYAGNWVAVKSYWRLTVTDREKAALREMLRSCPAQSSAPRTSSPAPAGS
jgi:hypothetical protein